MTSISFCGRLEVWHYQEAEHECPLFDHEAFLGNLGLASGVRRLVFVRVGLGRRKETWER